MSNAYILKTLTTGNSVWAPYSYLLQRVFFLNCTASQGLYGWLLLPGGRSVSFNIDPELGEVLVGKLGPLEFYRPETEQERIDRECGEEEAAYEAYYANNY